MSEFTVNGVTYTTTPMTISKTYAEMQALIASNGLDPRLFYKITDRGDRGLVFRAVATNRLESDGIRYMLCPATYATTTDEYNNKWIGVWNAIKQESAVENDLTIWNGLVWKAGATLAGTSPDTTESGWTVIQKASFTNHEYIEMIFGVTYDFENDWINGQDDIDENHFGGNKNLMLDTFGFNPVDVCDWNYKTSGFNFFKNKCFAIYNISETTDVYNNRNYGFIRDIQGAAIFGNTNLGNIDQISKITRISNNDNSGSISQCSSLSIYVQITNNQRKTGNITGVFDADVTDIVVDKTGTAE